MTDGRTAGGAMQAGPLRAAALAAVALVGGFFGVTALVGGFATLDVVEREAGPFGFAYLELYGADFAQMADLSLQVRARLEAAGLEIEAPMAVFYGDSLEGSRPNEAGVLVSADVLARVGRLADPPLARTIPRVSSLTTSFPRSGVIATVVGYFRAESVLGEYREGRRYRREPLVVIDRPDRIDYVQAAVPN